FAITRRSRHFVSCHHVCTCVYWHSSVFGVTKPAISCATTIILTPHNHAARVLQPVEPPQSGQRWVELRPSCSHTARKEWERQTENTQRPTGAEQLRAGISEVGVPTWSSSPESVRPRPRLPPPPRPPRAHPPAGPCLHPQVSRLLQGP